MAPARASTDGANPGETERVRHRSSETGHWVESGAEVRRGVALARSSLAGIDPSDDRRTEAERLFAARARKWNRAIARHNLLAPSARWHMPSMDIGHDLTRRVPTDERRPRSASAAPSPFDSSAAPGI
jgi:hypothetical protein